MSIVVLALLSGVLGCQPGIRWRGYSFDFVHRDAVRDNRLTFVYFRSPYSVQCTRFEDAVLSSPEVRAATEPLYCAVVDFGWDRELALRWGLTQAPSFALISPAGEVLASGMGEMSARQVLDAIAIARERHAASAAR